VGEELSLVREGLAALCEVNDAFQVVAQCADGAAVVEAVESLAPDLALLDFDLPKLFTLEAVRKLKDAGSRTKFVIISDRRDRKTVVEVLRSGAGAYVLKSSPSRHLLDAFRQVMAGGVYVTPLLEIDKIFSWENNHSSQDPLHTLSAREYQVFLLLVEGIRAKEIAARLVLSPKTIDTYRASLMRKLEIYDLAGLVKFALNRGLTHAAGA
jgi:DNA-binding NarL/FixJ family response regulator